MRFSEVSLRYASALYETTNESGSSDKAFANLRDLKAFFDEEKETYDFLLSPLYKASDKETVLKTALKDAGLTEEVFSLVLLLAKKNRLSIFTDVVEAFQFRSDEAHGVKRGEVCSTTVLSPEERQNIEKLVSEATGKKVILTYKEDKNLIGGLVAKVGSFTFDDTINSHIRRLKEELKRSAH